MQTIELTPVESSQIHALGHSAETNTLAIQFKSKAGPGSVYHYANVSPELYAEFVAAESIGAFFGKNIKPAADKYPFVKVS